MAANTKKYASLGEKSGLLVNVPPVLVGRSIIFPALPVKGKWRRPLPLLVPRVVVGMHRGKGTMTKICICWRAQYIAPLWVGQDLYHMNSCDSSSPLVYLAVSSVVQRTLCVYLYTRRSLLVTVAHRLTLLSWSGGTGRASELVLFTLLPGCWVTLGSSQPLHFSLPQFL